MRKYLFLILCTLIFASCSTREEIVFFQNIEQLEDMEKLKHFEPKIEVNDVLRIKVSSINDEVVEPYNMDVGNRSGGGGGSENAALNGYLVDVDGNITFPVLGEISVVNKTRSELEEELTKILRDYVTDATVRVRIVNFKVTVLGEVASRGVVQVPDERISIPQVIAQSGGITYNGQRENILVIRNNNGDLTYGHVDLTDASVFENPFFYLKQNDIVYVEPTYRQVKSAGFFSSPAGILSIVSSTISLIFIFTR